MNKSIRLTWAKSAFAAVVMILSLASCSSDGDEPEMNPADALARYESIVKLMYYADGTPRYTPTETENIYVAVAHTYEGAQSFCNEIAGGNWDGTNTTLDLGEYGTVKVSAPDREMAAMGVYNEISVNLKGYTAFTLKIFDSERADDDNGYTGMGKDYYTVDDNLKAGGKPLAPEDSKLGDVMWSDGNVYEVGYKPTDEDLVPVGIVVYKYWGDDDPHIPLMAKRYGWTHGFVMALKNASTDSKWRNSPTPVMQFYPQDIASAYGTYPNFHDGLLIQMKVYFEEGLRDFPAFQAVYEFRPRLNCPPYSNYPSYSRKPTSGWYIPSIGEWLEVCSDNGLINCISRSTLFSTRDKWKWIDYDGENRSIEEINQIFIRTGLASGRYDFLSSDYHWSATDYSSDMAYAVIFKDSYMYVGYMHKKRDDSCTRAFLAF